MGVIVRHRIMNFRWELPVVYGPANHDLSLDFLQKLRTRCQEAVLPVVIGGDFNLITSVKDKSSGLGNKNLMHAFNSFIGDFDLRDIYRGGGQIYLDKQSKIRLSRAI